jgi:hypothetical protein
MFRRALSMCPINFVFMSCKVKKQESPEYYSVVNSKTLGSHLNYNMVVKILKCFYNPVPGVIT